MIRGGLAKRTWIVFSVIFYLFCPAPGSAQTALSTVRGTVRDQTKAVVPGAEVTVTETGTNLARSVVSDGNGNYEISELKPGTYQLKAELPGFKSVVVEGMRLDSGEIRRFDVLFEIGETTDQVTVEAGAAVITTDSGTVTGTVNALQYKDAPIVDSIPYPGWQGLLSTLPGVVGQGWNVSIAGQEGTGISLQDDGVHNERSGNQSVNMNTYEEVKVVTVNNNADQARAASLNTTTKRGTNALHGRVYYKHTNSALGAREFFEPEKTPYKFHDFFGEVAGPILRDKTFFYVGWTHIEVPASSFPIASVPTLKMRQGDFSEHSQTIVDPLTGNPFPDNRIPENRLHPTSLRIQELYLPRPNLGEPGQLTNNHGYLFPYPDDYFLADYPTFRVDHNLSDQNSLYFRYMYYYSPYILANALPNFARTSMRFHDKGVVADTHIFSPSVVNTFRFGFRGDVQKFGEEEDGYTPPAGNEAVAAIGLQGVNPRGLEAQGFPRMSITGLTAITTGTGGVNQDHYDFSFEDSITWSTGRHVWKFGFQYYDTNWYQSVVPLGAYGDFSFDGFFTGIGYADFLLGFPRESTRLDPLLDRRRTTGELGLYIMDSFKVSPNLTLDYGLRWDYFPADRYKDDLMYNWDPATGDVIVPEVSLSKISPLYPTNITVRGGQVVGNPDKSNFRPRLGIAYRLSDDLILRGGYGVYTERLSAFSRAQGGGPFQISETYINAIENGQPLFAFPNPFPASLASANIPSQSVSGYPLDTSNGEIHQFNVSLEKQVSDIGIRLSYVGSRSRNLNYDLSINKPEPSLIPFAPSRRPYPQFVGTSFIRNDGKSNYDSMQLEVRRRTGWFTFNGNYTWSSNLHNFLKTENPYDVTSHWSRDDFNPRHRAVITTIVELPWGHGRRFLSQTSSFVNAILGGWKLQTMSYFATGKYFSPRFSGLDPSGTNTVGGLPDRVSDGNLPRGERSVEKWFEPSAFVVPPPGRFGNSGVNVLQRPGLNVHHLALVKSFRLGERFTLSYNASMANVFNHPHFNAPLNNISTPDAGRLSSTPGWSAENEGARRVMMQLRLEW